MTVPEIVAHPVEVIQKLYRQAGCPTAADGDWEVVKQFEQAIAGLGAGEIPLLHKQAAEQLPHHSLVRFYGMVQDLLNPEYYVGAFQRPDGQWVTTKFCDPDMPEHSEDSSTGFPVVWERRPIVCVPVPGLSNWAVPAAAQSASTAAAVAAASLTEAEKDRTTSCAGGPAEEAQPQGQTQEQSQLQQQQQPGRAKRERSSDADAAMDADSIRGTNPTSLSPRGALAQQQPPQGEHDDNTLDTDLAGDQGLPGPASAPVRTAPEAADMEEDEGTARPRVRRREDPSAAAATVGTAAAGGSDGGSSDDVGRAARDDGACGAGCREGRCPHTRSAAGAAGEGAAAPGAQAQEGQQELVGEVPGSCMVYLYDNAPALVLHEVVEVIGILSHMPQLAALEYDNQDDPFLAHELASLGLDNSSNANQHPDSAGNASADASGNHAAGGVSGRHQEGERLAFEAMRAAHPPTSKVMRLHGIIVRRSPSLVPTTPAPADAAPAAGQDITLAPAEAAATATTGLYPSPSPAPGPQQLRERALGLLRWALGGDAVAAEYVLLQLVARVAGRGDPAALGQLALNLCRCPAAAAATEAPSAAAGSTPGPCGPVLAAERLGPRGPGPLARALHAAVSSLVPLSAALPLTVEACNGVSWAPARDLSRERTAPSPLQLPPGTLLLLDETVMAPGQLSSRGVASMQALMAVARQQELMYDFETYQHPVPVDLPLIVMTQGRSLLRDSLRIRVPLNATQPFPSAEAILAAVTPNSATAPAAGGDNGDVAMTSTDAASSSAPSAAAAAHSAVAAAELPAVRSFLAAARAGHDGYELAEGMSSVLEQYFVNARRSAAGAAAAGGDGAPAGGNGAAAAAAGGGDVMSAEEFHLKLTLARLLVLSHGEKQLTQQRWQQLLQLEHTREARLRVGA
ncbi:hypothetical protein Agub_g339 [Astrephomene gubernaculifera]|uniref:Mini-chromosome maintenance complex-binding protein n=1 Tax=Astrephomene gubernaculifera TaxID=47775 RepID=A0AAD3HGJ5_9CHLO|nr:hypothetical protein Agub_g339 [Astrephomene gubernaculifera]